jgi:hypothetical protein
MAARGEGSKRARAAERYREHRSRAAERGAAEARAGQDIGEIPPVADPKRRKRGGRSLKVFCETYLKHVFSKPWSPEHRRVLRKAERVIRHGGCFADAMPRGYGKTSICEAAILWGILYGHRHYPFFIGSIPKTAKASLESIKLELETNDLLYADFPETCHPFRALEGIANRCKGQRFRGERTYIRWTEEKIVVAEIPGAVSAGAVVEVTGITGAFRGAKYNRPNGEAPLRPDVVMIDDAQTRESARSVQLTKQRLDIIEADVMKLGGPGVKIAAFFPCTVIEPDDLADQILKKPDWQGERIPMLKSLPTRMDLWEEYDRIRRLCLEATGDIAAATKFYRQHRREMDRGADPTWPHYFEPGEISNIQHAMNWYLKSPKAFWSECQNQPIPPEEIPSDALTAAEVARRVNGRPRGEVPSWATRLTAYIDVQEKILLWVVCAWADDFTGAVIDYGVWPDQARGDWTKRDVRRTYRRAFPSAQFEGALRAALEACTAEILGREWRRDAGGVMRIERCLIDANAPRTTETVYEFCHVSRFSSLVMPSHGESIGVKNRPWHEYEQREGERLGHHWRVRRGQRAVAYMLIDTNYWKCFVQERLRAAVGDHGAITLFGTNPDGHRLFAEHLTSEYGVPKTAKGRTLIEWDVKTGRPDNDWWDCLVGATAAASYQGVVLPGAGMTARRRKRRIDLNQLRNQQAS